MNRDFLFVGALAALVTWVYIRRQTAAGYPVSLPWTLTGLPWDPDYIPPPPERSIQIANRTIQPSFQGGTRSPSTLQTQVEESAAGNVFAGVPFMY